METKPTIIAVIFCLALWALVHAAQDYAHLSARIDDADQRVTVAERTLNMLSICFPGGHYKADAAPTCPAFRKLVEKQLEGNEEPVTMKGNHDAK